MADYFVKKLRRYWRKEEISKAEVARRLGANQTTINHWFTGNFYPGKKSIKKICKLLDLPLPGGLE